MAPILDPSLVALLLIVSSLVIINGQSTAITEEVVHDNMKMDDNREEGTNADLYRNVNEILEILRRRQGGRFGNGFLNQNGVDSTLMEAGGYDGRVGFEGGRLGYTGFAAEHIPFVIGALREIVDNLHHIDYHHGYGHDYDHGYYDDDYDHVYYDDDHHHPWSHHGHHHWGHGPWHHIHSLRHRHGGYEYGIPVAVPVPVAHPVVPVTVPVPVAHPVVPVTSVYTTHSVLPLAGWGGVGGWHGGFGGLHGVYGAPFGGYGGGYGGWHGGISSHSFGGVVHEFGGPGYRGPGFGGAGFGGGFLK